MKRILLVIGIVGIFSSGLTSDAFYGLKNKQPSYRYSRLKNKRYWLLKGESALG